WLLANFMRFAAPVGEIVAGYAGLAALALIGSLGWTVLASPTLHAPRPPRAAVGRGDRLRAATPRHLRGDRHRRHRPAPAPRVAAQLHLPGSRGLRHRALPALRRPRGGPHGSGLLGGDGPRGARLRRAL